MAAVIEPTLRWHDSGLIGAGPGLWYGKDAVDGTARDWLKAPLGSIYIRNVSGTSAVVYAKTAAAGATADWARLDGAPAAGSAALLHGAGTSSAKATTATANVNFLGWWVESTAATAGSDTRGMYLRLYLNGATTGGGDALRAFTTVEKAVGTAHGIHASLSHGATGSLSGQGDAVRATLQLKTGTATGTLSALHGEIWLDAAASAPPVTSHGILRLSVGGDVTNVAAVTNLMYIDGVKVTAASSGVADMVTTGCADANDTVRIKILINGTPYWLGAVAAAPAP